MKDGYVADVQGQSPLAEAELSQEDMAKINQYTRRPYGPEEVFVFSMVLCDNQVDRDGERFPIESLEKLRELFLGKTCIFDHQRVSANQAARIFDTALEQDAGELTEAGEPLTKLSARAYLPRTKGSEEIIAQIDSGMLKEVSVSCAVGRKVCSVCGQEDCGHEPGKEYNGQTAHRVLLDPTDAYECSFVAVPAQKGAGVTKRYGQWDGLEKLFGMAGGTPSRKDLEKRWRELEQEAQWGRKYRESRTADVLKYSAIVQPDLPREVMKSAVKGLSMQELDAMGRTYERMAQKALPLKPQLAPEEDAPAGEWNKEYKI